MGVKSIVFFIGNWGLDLVEKEVNTQYDDSRKIGWFYGLQYLQKKCYFCCFG